MDGHDPFGYKLSQYLWVIGIACVGGLVKHLNQAKQFSALKLVIDVITAGFTGVLTFWLCESIHVQGPVSAIMIAVGGLMGNRAWKEFENIWRAKLGINHAASTNPANQVNVQPAQSQDEVPK